jgi:hypothetical protein
MCCCCCFFSLSSAPPRSRWAHQRIPTTAGFQTGSEEEIEGSRSKVTNGAMSISEAGARIKGEEDLEGVTRFFWTR